MRPQLSGKAIRVTGRQAQVIQADCILCGRCMVVCPQNAKEDISCLEDIRRLMAQGKEGAAAVAPLRAISRSASGARGENVQTKLELVEALESGLSQMGKNVKLSMC